MNAYWWLLVIMETGKDERKMHTVLIWGCGNNYNTLLTHKCFSRGGIQVNAVIDSNNFYYKKIDGFPLIGPEDIHRYDYEYIIVTVQNFSAIISQARLLGIESSKLIPSRVFQLPLFDFDEYLELRSSRISILTDYCLGGYLYHRFGLQFNSPTVNMFMRNKSYLAFLQDLDRHIKSEIQPITDYKPGPDIFYPCGQIMDDCVVVFNHSHSFTEGAQLWRKRARRFNFNNYIAIMTIEDDESAYSFERLPLKYKLGFYYKDLRLSSILYTPEWQTESVRVRNNFCYSAFVNRIGENSNGQANINWLKLLLHKDGWLRKT